MSELIIKYEPPLLVLPGRDWSYRNYSKNGTTIEFYYRLLCPKDFYGSSCGKFCQPRDDKHGHTKCLPNGTKACLPGYNGTYCDKGMNWSKIFGTETDLNFKLLVLWSIISERLFIWYNICIQCPNFQCLVFRPDALLINKCKGVQFTILSSSRTALWRLTYFSI